MNIGNRIAILRKQNNLTQEQLANAVGVSIPAVSKWENGVTAPDIELLAPIARMLNTDLNDLLSFKEELTDEEVKLRMTQIKQICKKEGYQAGITKAFDLLKEYPNNDYLKLEVGTAIGMYAYTIYYEAEEEKRVSEKEFQMWIDKSTALFEEVYRSEKVSENPILKTAALSALASRYIQGGRLEEAEELLTIVPKQQFDGTHMLPIVYFQQEKLQKAKEAVQRNILSDIQNITLDIKALYNISIKEQDFERALCYAESYYQVGKSIPFLSFYPSELLTEVYLFMNETDEALSHFSDYVNEIISNKEIYETSAYFDAISDSIVTWRSDAEDTEEDIRFSMCKVISENPLYQPLLEGVEGRKILKRLEDTLKASQIIVI